MSIIRSTMRAWTFTSRGAPSDVLKLRSDVPRPSATALSPTEVIVRVLYASVNVGYGILIKNMPHPTSAPWIPDLAFSGVIDAVGSDVSNVKVGDVVFGGQNFTAHFKYGGVMTEYLVSPADFVVLKPDNVSLQHAAGLSAQGCSVVQLMEVSKIKRGDKVLITAASGGLGTLLVQACKSVVGENGTIVATCSGPNMDMVRKLGADEVIDYTKHTQLQNLFLAEHTNQPFDAIIDIAGTNDELYTQSPAYLKKTGLYLYAGNVRIAHGPDGSVFAMLRLLLGVQIRRWRPTVLGGVPRQCKFYSARVTKESLEKVHSFAAEGNMSGVIDSEWEMEDVLKAYDRLATGRAKGKIIVHIQDL